MEFGWIWTGLDWTGNYDNYEKRIKTINSKTEEKKGTALG
jgi:hypothetical protein